MWVNSIQFRAGRVSDAEAVALGGPSADGIPQVIPSSSVTGQWDFDFGDLLPTVGKPLQYYNGQTRGAPVEVVNWSGPSGAATPAPCVNVVAG